MSVESRPVPAACPRVVLLCASIGCSVCVLGTLAGCTQSSATTFYTPITGIQVRASDVTSGHGCGLGTGQVYKYVALVSNADDDAGRPPFTSGVFDCFADGLFSNLSSLVDGGDSRFRVDVYEYDSCAFPCKKLACAQVVCPCDGGVAPAGPATCPGDDAAVASQVVATAPANWRATCTATEAAGITSIATCVTVEPNDSDASPPDAGSSVVDGSME
jgi:hypothetical protein